VDGGAAGRGFLARPDVLNVAITRARDHQIVFCSFDPDELAPDSLLRRYLDDAGRNPLPPVPAAASRDPSLAGLLEALAGRGIRTWPAFEVAGFVVDLVVERAGASAGVDLVGFPGPHAPAFDLERCRMLRRAGLAVFPLSLHAWRTDPVRCLAALEDLLDSAAREGSLPAPRSGPGS
jgi:hypothetical protein